MSVLSTKQSTKKPIIMLKYLVSCMLFLLITATLIVQNEVAKVQREYVIAQLPVDKEITIDDKLSDFECNDVQLDDEFTVFEPINGKITIQRTRCKITYDAKFLYVVVGCFDSIPSKIESRPARRVNFSGDWVQIIIDSYNDKRTAFHFNVSSA
ncbi:hypothetical protein LCGC14_0050690 [marine sediment metagenome]|uniref:Carbohydrate-binding domain-containing protein n=2 Tax=root TaxID=1 RepID=A0A0F9VUI1_9ZZZZ